MKKTRIMHIIGQLGVGGCETQLLELCRRMDKTRFDLTVCWYWDTPDCLRAEFEDAGVSTVFLEKASMPLWRFFLRLRQCVKESAPDIVHTWLESANFWGRLAAVTCGVAGIVASDRVEVKEANVIARLSELFLANRTVRLANSAATARSVQEYYGVSTDRVRIIYNAVDVPDIDLSRARREIRNELGVSLETKLVLMVGRLVPQKNYPMYLRVAERVCKKRDDVVFLSAGRGALLDSLRAEVNRAGLGGRVHFLGVRDDIPRLLRASDVFCFTTDYEGFPNAILEAMAAGLPVAVTAFPGVEELITDQRIGIVVPLDDDKRMAELVNELLDDEQRRRELGAAAKSYVVKEFSWESLNRTMDELYCGLADGRGRI